MFELLTICEVELEVLETLQRADPLPERGDVAQLKAIAEVQLEVLETLQRADSLPETR